MVQFKRWIVIRLKHATSCKDSIDLGPSITYMHAFTTSAEKQYLIFAFFLCEKIWLIYTCQLKYNYLYYPSDEGLRE